ncbi:MAG TPA: hypothetical protein PKA61_06530 [Nitrospira sp.]|nr:hypothetical protein [Nitrospira sp.]
MSPVELRAPGAGAIREARRTDGDGTSDPHDCEQAVIVRREDRHA